MEFDMHVHTVFSPCSRLTIPEILEHAGKKGLSGVCITDHNTMKIRHMMKEGIQENGICVIFGMEYETKDGDFLVFAPTHHIPGGMDARALLSFVHASGGAAVCAHPFRKNRGAAKYIVQEGLCTIVEETNGRNLPHENEMTRTWLSSYDLAPLNGSDAHSKEELGAARTVFTEKISKREDLITLLGKKCFFPKKTILL